MVGTLGARWIRSIEIQQHLPKGSLTWSTTWDIVLSNKNYEPFEEFVKNAETWDRNKK